MIKKIALACVVAVCCGVTTVDAQLNKPISDKQNLYSEAKKLFYSKDYAAAKQKLVMMPYDNSISEKQKQEIKYMVAACSFRLKDGERIDTLRDILQDVQDSPYKNRVEFMLGMALYEDGNIDEALAMLNSCEVDKLPEEDKNLAIYASAVCNVKVGNLDEAYLLFDMLRYSKYSNDGLYYMGYIKYKQGDYKQALKEFNAFRQTKDNLNKGIDNKFIVDIYLKSELYERAEEYAKRFLAERNDRQAEADLLKMLGEATFRQEKYTESIKYLEQYMKKETEKTDRRAHFMLGISYYNVDKYSASIQNLGKATLTEDDMAQNANLYIGLSYLNLFDKNKARMAFEQAANANFDLKVKEQAAYNYAISTYETSYSAFGESVNVFEQFLNNYPSSPYSTKIGNYLTDVYGSTTNYEAALNSINRVNRPSEIILSAKQKVLFNLGKEEYINGNMLRALGYFEQAIELGRFNRDVLSKTYYWCAEAYYRDGAINKAEDYLNKAISTSINSANEEYSLSHYSLGYIYFNRHRYSSAQDMFNKFVRNADKSEKELISDALTRIGDCAMTSRNFERAKEAFAQAERLSNSSGDYSLLQTAMIQGIQKEYFKKISTINTLISKYPQSAYIPNAIYEKGRAYVLTNNNAEAIKAFSQLKQMFPETELARKSATEIGLIYFRNEQYDKAINAYKEVVDKYPMSEEAKLAMADMKNVYMEINRVDEFVAYNRSKSNIMRLNVSDEDSLTYASAENMYMRGRAKEADDAFKKYISSFPEGAYVLDANYRLFQMAKDNKHEGLMLMYAEEIMKKPNNKYEEEVLKVKADLHNKAGRHEQAMQDYKLLVAKTVNDEVKLASYIGIARNAYIIQNSTELIQSANYILSESRLSTDLKQEILYYRAKTYSALDNKLEYIRDLRELKADTRNKYGAEARYLYANELFLAKKYNDAEKELLSYIEESTPHTYWLARSFVLLSDVYFAMNKEVEAVQFLKSLKQNYKAKDDISTMIEERLKDRK